MRASSLEKVVFVASLTVLSFLYGYTVRALEWPPHGVLSDALDQARRLGEARPDFVVPRVYDRAGARTLLPDRVQSGLTMVTTLWDDAGWKPGVKLVDAQGRTVHEWRLDPDAVFPDSASRRGLGLEELDIQGSHLFPNGEVLVNVEYAGTVRLDACSRVLWQLPAGGHHSISRVDDGTFYIPGVTSEPRMASPAHPAGLPGVDRPVYQDQMLRVSGDGEVLGKVNVLDVLHANGLVPYLLKGIPEHFADPTHLNDVEPLPGSMADEYPLFGPGDLLVSLRAVHLVFVFDPASGRVKWHASEPFILQHDPDFMGDGWIGVFDNNWDGTARGTLLGGSRIVAIQPHTDSMRVLYPTEFSDPFYTATRGKWQQLENGNLLLTESEAGRVVEVGPDGRTVWEWVVEPYDERSVPYVSKGARVDLTRDDVRAWPCSREEPPRQRKIREEPET